MTNKKLTDNEIIKALEDIIKHLDFTQTKSGENVLANALDLINRQKAEIERLNKEKADILAAHIWNQMELEDFKLQTIKMLVPRENEPAEYAAERAKHLEERAKRNVNRIKAKAYKECIEKVEKIICDNTYPDFDVNHNAVNIWKAEAYKDINNLLKEWVGDSNEN